MFSNKHNKYRSEKPVSQKSKVTHLTTIITKNTGHVWLSYTVTRYGREGEIINHTGDGPVLLYIEKINNEWVVVDKDVVVKLFCNATT